MIDVFRSAAELQSVCEHHDWRFCFIGGVALQRWGEPRFTRDADITLITGIGGEELFVDALLGRFEGRIANARDFALRHRVLLLRSASGVGLDVALGALPFEESAVRRSSHFEYPGGLSLRTCSAEDLVVFKSFAARGQDWVDVERILVRQGSSLDWDYVLLHLRPLAEIKEAPEILVRLEQLRLGLGAC